MAVIITEEYARIILEMEGVCYSEGLGPDTGELLHDIAKEYPHLTKDEEFRYLFKQ